MIRIAPTCSTTKRRFVSFGGAVTNTGRLSPDAINFADRGIAGVSSRLGATPGPPFAATSEGGPFPPFAWWPLRFLCLEDQLRHAELAVSEKLLAGLPFWR